MSDQKREEFEQGEAVRQWLKDNFQTMIMGVAGGLSIIYGWQYFQNWQQDKYVASAELYQAFDSAIESGSADVAQAQLAGLSGEFSRSTYTSLARLRMAGHDAKDDAQASIAQLDQVIQNTRVDALRAIASLRKARLLAETGELEGAKSLLATVELDSFKSLTQELSGDILLLEGKLDAARTAYQSALDNLDAEEGGRPLLEMKLNNLGQFKAEAESS